MSSPSSSLLETLTAMASPEVTRTGSAHLDEHEYGIGKTLEAAFMAILYGLDRNSSDIGVMGDVARLVDERGQDPAGLGDVAGLVAAGESSPKARHGARLVSTLFGARAGAITAAIARASGVGLQTAGSLVPTAASLVLATIGKRLGPGGANANAVAGLVIAERRSLTRVLPAYLARLIGAVREGGTKAMAGSESVAGGLGSLVGSLSWLLLPLLLLLAVAWYLLAGDATRYEARDPTRPGWSTSDRSSDRDRRSSDSSASRGDRPIEWPVAGGTEPRPDQPSATPATRRPPPLPGLIRIALFNGYEIDVVPVGVEPKLIAFIDDRYSVVDKTRWFDFDRVRFLSGSANLTPGSRVQLRNVVSILKAYPNVAIKIGGYTDNVGDPGANLRLSEARAKRVMEELIRLGIPQERLEAEGYGELHPIADNATADGRAKNRRTAVSVRAK
ncbi:MAG: OmpA family protein [Hyphomicrobium sp.]